MKKTIAMVSAVALFGAVSVAQANGQKTYQQSCATCHAAGIANAPKFGDKAAWKDRIAKGADTLHKHAIQGFKGDKGFMPAKGGNASLSDDAVKAAVDYMVAHSK